MGQSYKRGLICSAVETKYGNMGSWAMKSVCLASFSFSGTPEHNILVSVCY